MGRLWLLVLVACSEHGESDAKVTLAISGSLSEVNNGGAAMVAVVGDSFAGTIVYQGDAVDTGEGSFDSAIYRFTSAPSKIAVTINGILYETEPTAIDMLINVVDRSNSDTLVFQSATNRCFGCPGIEFMSWQLDDATGTALTGTALPTTPPDVTRFTQQVGLSINGGAETGGFFLRGEVANATLE